MTKGWHLEDIKTLEVQKKKTNSLTEKWAKDTLLAQKGGTNGDYIPEKICRIHSFRAEYRRCLLTPEG